MEDIESMGIKQLKEFITARGGDPSSCVEKTDLKKLASQLSNKPSLKPTKATHSTTQASTSASIAGRPASVASSSTWSTSASSASHKSTPSKAATKPVSQQKPDDDYVDENADVSSSDDEESESKAGNGKTLQRRFSVFRVKKFVTSKIGNTSAGRATILKVLGEEGDIIVQALRSIASKIRDEKTAKECKKDSIRLCLKAYNLWKHKDLTLENTKTLQTDVQLIAEIFCRECNSVNNGRVSDITPLARLGQRIHDTCVQLMTPHIQPRNAARLSELLKFFFSADFFNELLNGKDSKEERAAMEKSVATFLLPLAPIISGERERSTLARLQALQRGLENKRFDIVLDHPQVTQLFQQFLDLEKSVASRNGLRFLLAVRDFEKTSSRELMKLRAPKIVDRFMSPSAELKLSGVDPELIKESCEMISTGSVGMGTFLKVAEAVRRQLEEDFKSRFVKSDDFVDIQKRTADDIANLERQLQEEGSMVITPSHKSRKSVV